MDSAAEADGDCALCGLPVPEDPPTGADGATFCCPGCRDVAARLDDVEAVDEADVRERVDPDGTEPAESAATPDDEPPGVDPDDQPPDGTERVFLRVHGMHCTTCEAFVESLATGMEGVHDASASYVTEALRIDHDPDVVERDALVDAVSTAGYRAVPREEADPLGRGEEDLLWRLAAGVMFGMMVMLPYFIYIYPVHFQLLYSDRILALAREQVETARYFYVFLFAFTSAVLFYTGGPLLRGALVSLRARRPNMDLLVSLAALAAYAYSVLVVVFHLTGLHGVSAGDVYFDVSVGIVLVVTAGTYYESTIKRAATEKLSELSTARVAEARLYEDGDSETVPVEDLAAGDRVLVREGERVPVDGAIAEGDCTVDEAVVTGESLPVEKGPGDAVVGGATLTTGAAVVEVGEDATSSLDRIVDLVWNIQSAGGGVQGLADRLAVVFVPAVVALSVLAGLGYLATGASVSGALLVALTVLIVSCPCALGLATPLAVAAGIGEALERGLVVFDETVFERLREVDVVVFDKTGTLTTGEMEVRDADGPAELLADAAALEARSSHPVAGAIASAFGSGGADGDADTGDGGVPVSDGGRLGPTPAAADEADAGEPFDSDEGGTEPSDDPVEDFESHARGVSGVVDGIEVLVGHPSLFADRDWPVPERIEERADDARAAGNLPVVVGRDGAAEGVIVVGDEPRQGWEATVAGLSERGAEVVVLTGDEGAAADRFRAADGVDAVFDGVPSEGKAAAVGRLGADRRVAMVGDGTNDAPALARADLGIAMGGGTALAADAAEVAILDDDLASIERVFDLAAATRRRVRGNVAWALCYNAVAIPLAVTGLLNPLFAAAAMAASSLLVVTNSSRSLLDDE